MLIGNLYGAASKYGVFQFLHLSNTKPREVRMRIRKNVCWNKIVTVGRQELYLTGATEEDLCR